MPDTTRRSRPAACGWHLAVVGSAALLALAVDAPSAQQRADEEGAPASPSVAPAIRASLDSRFSAAQACVQRDDADCANRILDEVAAIDDLNAFESATLYNLWALLDYGSGDIDGALSSYESLLGLPRGELPPRIVSAAMRNVAMLHVEQERYEEGLESFDAWLDLPRTAPTADDYHLKATLLYALERYADAIEPLELAIAASGEPDESWHELLDYLRNRAQGR